MKAVFKTTKNKETKTDLKTLLSIYNDWYKIFPFDISYFQHLKGKYKATIPLHTGRTRYNKYTKENESEDYTKETLTEMLIKITKDILKTINGATLYEKGLLNDIENKKLELLINQRKINLKKFEAKNINDNTKYFKAIKFWFKGEKKFLEEITPLLKKAPQQTITPKQEENNLTVSTIEDWLFEFKEQKILIEKHYENLVNALKHYFDKGTFPVLENKIKVGRVNKKRFGWVLNRIFHEEGKGIEIDLLRFAKDSISIFEDVNFDESNLQKSNLYKYFTTKVKQHRKH